MEEIQTRCDIKDGGIKMFSIDICAYLDAQEDGQVRFAYRRQGGHSSFAQVIGILEQAKIHMILEATDWSSNDNEEEEDG